MNNLVGEKIKKLRKEKGLTQKSVAEKLNITDSYLSKIEKGQPPSLTLLNKFAEFFNVDRSYFFIDESELNNFSETEKELIFEPDLSLENVKEKFNFFKLDDKEITDDELKFMIRVLKAYRISKNDPDSHDD
ncbi:helix-turn-helix domain-containing protein [Bacillus spizizenii]|uniref:Helix-turn-helix domain-containing protein n=1 Tax=Bacillus vallismortis TaxID=72361 RepID=A0AAP3CHR9_BACVA|nr:helix-turn-helix transcriptional regulator [Bacillus vallismortis]MCY8315810.1 helix-turn-helix domain-containing protein [Bacillus vallismortis]MCY8692668.1 helix-turn-helix domain-containing protein [Bacillus spizizenii]